jgi:putative FmdB family regulatory protein
VVSTVVGASFVTAISQPQTGTIEKASGGYRCAMPLYEFRCRECDEVFEERRPMSEASAPATCPHGHAGAVRLLSVFASVGASGSPAPSAPAQRPAGGCGGACACAH